MNKIKYLKFLNPVFMFIILLIPFVTGSNFHWSLLIAAILVILVNGITIYKMTNTFEDLYMFSYFDSLTKIPNRLSSDLYCNQLTSTSKLSVALADLDNLKNTNDTYGHLTGDKMLKAFASIFFDCAGTDGFAARNGGDEFIVFFNGEMSRQKMEEFCEKLQKEIDAYNDHSSLHIRYSIGCAFGESNTDKTVRELVSLADNHMYQQKSEKKSAARRQKGCANDDNEDE